MWRAQRERAEFNYVKTGVTCTFGGYKRENKSPRSLGTLRIASVYEAATAFGHWKVGVGFLAEKSLPGPLMSVESNLCESWHPAGKGPGWGVTTASVCIQLHHLMVMCPGVKGP